MWLLIAGLLIFLIPHSVRLVAEDWRMRQIRHLGEGRWKGLYSLIVALGLALIVAGYPDTRAAAPLWPVPTALRHLGLLLMLPAFLLLVAAYVPGNRVRRAVGHPMLAGVFLWAVTHLAVNSRPGDVLLFGSFAVWSAWAFVACHQRDARLGRSIDPTHPRRDLIVFGLGLAAWAAFTFALHTMLMGVAPVA